jgi:2-haloacid dehalogenase
MRVSRRDFVHLTAGAGAAAALSGRASLGATSASDPGRAPELRVEACVFDAYGTLFDVNSAAREARDVLGERWQALADLWRSRQLQYTWLRSLMGRHADFWQVTGDALDFAMATLKLEDRALRERLMRLYLEPSAYPDVPETLTRLKAARQKLAILSNGTPRMLSAAAEKAGIANLLDHVLSVEEVGTYKPHPSVYRLAAVRLNLAPERVCFVSSNAWDAHGAKAFGFRTVWCNRANQLAERIPAPPDAEVATLAGLPELLQIA